MPAGQLTPEQSEKHREISALAHQIKKSDELLAANFGSATAIAGATAQLLSVIAKVLVLEAVDKHGLTGRVMFNKP